jgi:ABC-type sugar transport system permease subunit
MSDANETTVVDDQEPKAASRTSRTASILIGLGLMIPAALACLSGYLWPTARTFWLSLRDVGFDLGDSAFVGFENYNRLLSDQAFGAAISFTFLLTLVRLAAVAAVPLLLALGASTLGRTGRRILRVIFTIPIALYMPAAAAFGWRLSLVGASRSMGINLGDPATVRALVLLLDGLYTLALACGLGLIALLPALEGRRDEDENARRSWMPLLAVWLIGLLATAALTPQTFAFVSILTSGGPARATTTLTLFQYDISLRMMRFGLGAALSAVELLPLLILGLLAGIILVFTRLQIDLTPTWESSNGDEERQGRGRAIRLILGGVALLIALAACALTTLPLATTALGNLDPAGFARFIEELHPVPGLLLSIVVPLLGLLILLPVTYLAALGIGALRPLGRWSEALLLLFTPWLFVTTSPLSLIFVNRLQRLDRLNRPLAINPPIALSIVGLIVLALFFKGRAAAWRTGQEQGDPSSRGFFGEVILPSLPLVAALGLGALLVGMQRYYWQAMVYYERDVILPSMAWPEMGARFFAGPELWAPAVLVYIVPPFLLLFVGLSVLQVLYLDRLVLRQEEPEEEARTFEDYVAESTLEGEPDTS